jgi:hypothetical protein
MSAPVTLFSISNDPVVIPLEHWNNAYLSQTSLNINTDDVSFSDEAWNQIYGSVEQSYIASIGNVLIGDATIKIDDINLDTFKRNDFLQSIISSITSESIQSLGTSFINTKGRKSSAPFLDGDTLIFPSNIQPGRFNVIVRIPKEISRNTKFFTATLRSREVLVKDGNEIIDDEWLFTTNHLTGPYYNGTYNIGYNIQMAIRLKQTSESPPPPPPEVPVETEEDAIVPSAEIVYVPTLLKSTFAETSPKITIPSDYRIYLNPKEAPFYTGMLIKNWNGFTQHNPIQRPMFFASGGYNGAPFVRFNRTNSQFLEGGRQYFRFQTNGGYSVIAMVKFNGTIGSWERVFDFFNGAVNSSTDGFGMTRSSTSTSLNIFTLNGSTNVSFRNSLFTGIQQNTWYLLAYTVNNNVNIRSYDINGNGTTIAFTAGGVIADTVKNITFIGRSSFSSNAYSNMDLGLFIVYDRPLGDPEMSTVISHYVNSTATTLPDYYIEDESIEKLKNGSFETDIYTTTFVTISSNDLDNWDVSSGTKLIRTGNSTFGNPVAVSGSLYVLGIHNYDCFARQEITNLEMEKPYTLIFYMRNRINTESPILQVAWYEGQKRCNLLLEDITSTVAFDVRRLTFIPTSTRGTIEFRNVKKNSDTIIMIDGVSLKKDEEYIYTKYPPAALTSTSTVISGISYGNGTYTVTTSSNLGGREGFRAFDSSYFMPEGSFWRGWGSGIYSGGGYYNNTTGAYRAATTLGGVTGEWIKIQLPSAIILRRYTIFPRAIYSRERSPQSFTLIASNDNINWTILDQRKGLYWSLHEGVQGEKTFIINNNNHYSYYAFVVHIVGNYDTTLDRDSVDFLEVELYSGIAEPNYKLYPPAGMTAASTTITGQPYGNGTYIASSSGNHNITNYPPHRAFTKAITTNDGWHSVGSYSMTTGDYIGGVNLAGTPGEWLRIQLPEAIVLKKYVIYAWGDQEMITTHRGPGTFKIYGSNNGVTWIELDSQVNQAWSLYENTVGSKAYYLQNNTTPYTYYTMVTNKAGFGADGTYNKSAVLINEWQLFDIDTEPALIEYPSDGLTDNNGFVIGKTYGNGSYEITTSSVESTSTYQGFYVFDYDTTSTNYWSSAISYNATTGEYAGANGIAETSGEWIKIKLPEPIVLKRYVIYPRWDTPAAVLNRSPRSMKLMASNNNINWFVLENHIDLSWNIGENTQGEKIFFLDSNTASYMYYALIVPQVGSGLETSITRESLDIGEWKLYTSSDSPVNYYNLIGEISPIFWFDPVSSSQFSLNGTQIAKWYNKKNPDIYLLQNNSTYMPTYDSANGTIAVTRGNYLDFNTPFSYISKSTLCIVTTPSTMLQSYIFANTTEPGLALALITAYENKSFEFYDTTLRLDIDPTPFASNTSLHIIIMVFNDGLLDLFYDGNQVAEGQSFTVTTEEITRLFETEPIGTNRGFQGTFGELLYLDYVASTTQRQRIEGYLANKFGITTLLPMAHPYHGTSFSGPNGPTDIMITSQTIQGGNAIGDLVGFLSTVDNDTNDFFTYSIVGGDIDDFYILGDGLHANKVFDSYLKSVYTITVRSTDSYGLFYDKSLNITIT